MYWKKLNHRQQQDYIQAALAENVNFSTDHSLGYPASKLDEKVFYEEAPFLKDAPLLQVFVANPNHIGCHTFGTSEKAFKGTQQVEREVLNMIAVDIFKEEPGNFDGYVATGGTEANLQALWMYRNYFINKYNASNADITIVASEDTHYSIAKGSNLLALDWLKIKVIDDTRAIDSLHLEKSVLEARQNGKKYFIVVANMGTTMFGSVDDHTVYSNLFDKLNLAYCLHIDAAYGGFVYPISNEQNTMNFKDKSISSITIDAHKMLQAPYGTGIFICKKGFISNTLTKEAEYVEGMDLTLCGSRSGANAVAVWMIMTAYGANGWFEKISILQMRTAWLCKELDKKGIKYFRKPYMNIVTIRAEFISPELAERFDLVPQKHDGDNEWYKIVIMDHVEVEHLMLFIEAL